MYTIGKGTRSISIKKWEIYCFKNKIIPLIFDETIPVVMDKPKFKKELQYQKNLPFLAEVQWDISDLPFVQNKVSHLNILRWN